MSFDSRFPGGGKKGILDASLDSIRTFSRTTDGITFGTSSLSFSGNGFRLVWTASAPYKLYKVGVGGAFKLLYDAGSTVHYGTYQEVEDGCFISSSSSSYSTGVLFYNKHDDSVTRFTTTEYAYNGFRKVIPNVYVGMGSGNNIHSFNINTRGLEYTTITGVAKRYEIDGSRIIYTATDLARIYYYDYNTKAGAQITAPSLSAVDMIDAVGVIYFGSNSSSNVTLGVYDKTSKTITGITNVGYNFKILKDTQDWTLFVSFGKLSKYTKATKVFTDLTTSSGINTSVLSELANVEVGCFFCHPTVNTNLDVWYYNYETLIATKIAGTVNFAGTMSAMKFEDGQYAISIKWATNAYRVLLYNTNTKEIAVTPTSLPSAPLWWKSLGKDYYLVRADSQISASYLGLLVVKKDFSTAFELSAFLENLDNVNMLVYSSQVASYLINGRF